MPRMTAAPINLSQAEQSELEKLVRRPSAPQQQVMRAKIILRAARGESHGQISRDLGITKDTSRLWRRRWLALQESELSASSASGGA